MKMTTQQKLDCLLRKFDSLAENQGDNVTLSAQDIAMITEECRFKSLREIAFYIQSLDGRGLVKSECSPDHTILQATITIDGYSYLDEIRK